MKVRHVIGFLLLLALIGAITFVALNREWLNDYYRGQMYQPTSDMVRIRNSLNLTERGEFLFNASQPTLNEREDFNEYCRDGQNEIAVLGCYASSNIYVYNIIDPELDGIRELTTAHELLHAVYARMSEDEKNDLVLPLEKVYTDNRTLLEADLGTYSNDERIEELYVRAGTEVADLPEILETHYAEIFKDQDAVVAYYNKYISAFRQLEEEMNYLKSEMEQISASLDQKMAEYEAWVSQLNANISEFNACAHEAGCFSSQEEFESERSALMSEQSALESYYYEINSLIDEYNQKVDQFNDDVTHGEELNTKINSSIKPQEVK